MFLQVPCLLGGGAKASDLLWNKALVGLSETRRLRFPASAQKMWLGRAGDFVPASSSNCEVVLAEHFSLANLLDQLALYGASQDSRSCISPPSWVHIYAGGSQRGITDFEKCFLTLFVAQDAYFFQKYADFLHSLLHLIPHCTMTLLENTPSWVMGLKGGDYLLLQLSKKLLKKRSTALSQQWKKSLKDAAKSSHVSVMEYLAYEQSLVLCALNAAGDKWDYARKRICVSSLGAVTDHDYHSYKGKDVLLCYSFAEYGDLLLANLQRCKTHLGSVLASISSKRFCLQTYTSSPVLDFALCEYLGEYVDRKVYQLYHLKKWLLGYDFWGEAFGALLGREESGKGSQADLHIHLDSQGVLECLPLLSIDY